MRAASIAWTCDETSDALTIAVNAYKIALAQSRHEEGTKRSACLWGPGAPNGNFAQMVLDTQQVRESAFDTLGLATDGTTAIKALVQEFHDTAAKTEHAWASHPFARIEGGRLRLRRDPRQSEPEGTAVLRQLVRRDLSRVRIEHLLMEIDALYGFSQHLQPPLPRPRTAMIFYD